MSTMYVLLEMQRGSSPSDKTRTVARSRGCLQDLHAEDPIANASSHEDIKASLQSASPKDIAANVV